MDMNTCKRKNLVKTIKPDTSKIQALAKSAKRKIEASNVLPKELGEPKISLMYDALRTILESIALERGYKIYNHECYTAFLKEVLQRSRLGDEFDNFRKVRNGINYYGKEVNPEEAKELLLQMKKFIEKIRKLT